MDQAGRDGTWTRLGGMVKDQAGRDGTRTKLSQMVHRPNWAWMVHRPGWEGWYTDQAGRDGTRSKLGLDGTQTRLGGMVHGANWAWMVHMQSLYNRLFFVSRATLGLMYVKQVLNSGNPAEQILNSQSMCYTKVLLFAALILMSGSCTCAPDTLFDPL